jgi:hypothetical protein
MDLGGQATERGYVVDRRKRGGAKWHFSAKRVRSYHCSGVIVFSFNSACGAITSSKRGVPCRF